MCNLSPGNQSRSSIRVDLVVLDNSDISGVIHFSKKLNIFRYKYLKNCTNS